MGTIACPSMPYFLSSGFINPSSSFRGFFAPSPTRQVSISSAGYDCRSGNKCSGSVMSGFNQLSSSSLLRMTGMRPWTVPTSSLGWVVIIV